MGGEKIYFSIANETSFMFLGKGETLLQEKEQSLRIPAPGEKGRRNHSPCQRKSHPGTVKGKKIISPKKNIVKDRKGEREKRRGGLAKRKREVGYNRHFSLQQRKINFSSIYPEKKRDPASSSLERDQNSKEMNRKTYKNNFKENSPDLPQKGADRESSKKKIERGYPPLTFPGKKKGLSRKE